MNEQQIGKIAKAAFGARFGEVKIIRVNVRSGFDHADDPMVDVNIIYDGKYEQLNGSGLLDVRREIVDKVWGEAEDNLGYPYVHFIAKSDLGRRDPATV